MKRFILITIFLLLICGTMFYFISLPHNISDTTAQKGILDLADHDFSHKLFNLDGEWEFYFNEFYTPKDFEHDGSLPNNTFIHVPLSWHKAGYPLTGYATYRLTLLSDETDLMMFVPEILNSSVIWVNGEKVFTAGQPGKAHPDSIPGIRNAFVRIQPENGKAQIVIQTANYSWSDSGLLYSIVLGHSDILIRDVVIRRVLLGFAIGIFMAMALYHIILFLHYRKEWVYLAFALVCLIASLRFLIDTNGLADLLLPQGLKPSLMNLFVLLLAFHVMAIIFFAHTAFKIPLKGCFRRIVYIGISLIAAIIPLVTHLTQAVLYLMLIPLTWTVISVMQTKRLREDKYNMLFLFALIIFIPWYPLNKIVFGDAMLSPGIMSNLFLVLSQFVMLSVSYAKMKRHEEFLAEHNMLLKRLNTRKNEFLQNMRHEMKNPLTVMATGIDFSDGQISREKEAMPEVREALEIVRMETLRLGRMIESMAVLASMDEISENRRRVDFAALLTHSAELFRLELAQKNIDIRIDLESDMPDVFIEKDRFIQVIANLLANAAAHTKNGRITLTANCDKFFITVCVADNGVGIPNDIISHVFDRGFSGRGSTGYGLHLCKTIIEAHGGIIEIESEPGEGTAITFTLPVYSGQEAGHNE